MLPEDFVIFFGNVSSERVRRTVVSYSAPPPRRTAGCQVTSRSWTPVSVMLVIVMKAPFRAVPVEEPRTPARVASRGSRPRGRSVVLGRDGA